MPKRGLSAYMFFANDQREVVRDENPGISFGIIYVYLVWLPSVIADRHFTGQVGKVLGEKWKKLSDKERKPYEQQARDDKARYEREKASWQEVCACPSKF